LVDSFFKVKLILYFDKLFFVKYFNRYFKHENKLNYSEEEFNFGKYFIDQINSFLNGYEFILDPKRYNNKVSLKLKSCVINFYQKHFKYSRELYLDDLGPQNKEKTESENDRETCETKQVIFNVRNHANLIVIIYFGLLRFMRTFYQKKKKLLN
jgi:hypothetical protein